MGDPVMTNQVCYPGHSQEIYWTRDTFNPRYLFINNILL